MNLLFSLLAGVIFGIGLLVSGMANPAKVIGFLDITRVWDPSLAFVMGGAISVAFFAFRFIKGRTQSVCGGPISLPTRTHIDKRLVGGAILFGLGWGLAGICPGPALVLLGTGATKGIVFVVAMLAGMLIFEQLEKTRQRH
ncbi:YeeE/YedE family protein [Pectobacteriaceae bacterium CE70]|uniref:DUF395-family membrane protein n=1 Tax=Serratia sp. (strain ATCC 39006) TaxID=104623 RepID=E7BBJ2_SERS3|nr:DUF6691 family protein [Serratia sp. ATCC 39006]WJV63375.1 YeeE/YedE family protein [Pectobacteriaceae bacterium C52]WJV67750.1 YeeE/YedE family protein [Pectobacteriaceae bacterium CE70]AUH01999.1 hypothetical protein CWC46_20725 [Serratia sp. ATCC 39006]AUH06321.1 hypothetical protein Ser39006_020720 [Serratia sp. ATCC 39006]CBY83978.1 DUF395-family membrane protein [Serratia sp. ATCC 39006]